ncbi:pickpocket protein 28-like [Calliphora vicina]|uniref:pickpocket protein 28-like n=1 Tax=Calliphora vicina TaxID=7373 RepID=UPI00325AB675
MRNLKNRYKGLNLKSILIQNTDEFCRNTTLHGMKYVADNRLKPSERCFFALSILTVVCLAIYLIARVYDKWSTTPVIVGINPEPTFITDEPFPAVSICNLNQALAAKAEYFSRNSPEYAMLQLLCKREVNTSMLRTLTNWNNLESFILNISQPCEDMLLDCRFGGRNYNCSHIFHPLVTDEGLCCVFNMLNPKFMYVSHTPLTYHNLTNYIMHKPVDWYSEKGYPDDLPTHFYPHKVPGVGESLGLSVTLDVQQAKYYCSSSSSVGFKFALHSPNESPNIRETGIFIENGKESKLRIKPYKTETEQHLRGINRNLRHCLFHNEGNLKFFAHYTQRNCEMECVAEISRKYCGCVSYFMPKIFNNISICSINDAKCERKVMLRMDNRIKSCVDDCLPSCYELNFEVDSFSTKLSHNGFDISNTLVMNMSHLYVEENIAVVHMYFKENSFRSNMQTEFVGISDFLSSIGGLMGLFLGFSFVSIAELIYYAIIRPYRSISKFTQTKDIYETLENGTQSRSAIPTKTLNRSVKKRYNNNVFPSVKIHSDKKHLVDHKMPLPYLLSGDLEKHGKSGSYGWLE